MPTRNSYRSTTRNFDEWLYQKRRLPEIALRGLENESKTDEPANRKRPPLEIDQVKNLWTATRTSKSVVQGYDGFTRYMLYLTAAATGFRVLEISSLVPESFELGSDFPMVKVKAAFTKNKNEANQPLPQYLVPVFQDWLVDKPGGSPLFPKLATKRRLR